MGLKISGFRQRRGNARDICHMADLRHLPHGSIFALWLQPGIIYDDVAHTPRRFEADADAWRMRGGNSRWFPLAMVPCGNSTLHPHRSHTDGLCRSGLSHNF